MKIGKLFPAAVATSVLMLTACSDMETKGTGSNSRVGTDCEHTNGSTAACEKAKTAGASAAAPAVPH
jgi:hypothetical protein